jgi:hypothetical protein
VALLHESLRLLCRAGVISLVLSTLVSSSWAQQQSFSQQGASASSAPSQSPPVNPDTVEQVQTNIDDLSKQPIPDKDLLLLRELDHIDTEIARATQQLGMANRWRAEESYYTDNADRIKTQSQLMTGFDCENNLSKFRDASQSYLRAYNDFVKYYSWLPNLDIPSIALPAFVSPDDAQNCNLTKAKFSSSDYAAAQKRLLDSTQSEFGDFLSRQSNLATAETKYIDALKKRRSAVQDKLNASQPAFQIGSNLWLLLLILATACVCTILGIKLFTPDLQMEWVASGQVIQFVTVMILLIVILALGLSSILHENTLGTLLGGIAGYVLAQGVGRSAARDARLALSPGTPPAGTPPAGTTPAGT